MKTTAKENACLYEVVKGTAKKASEHCGKIQAEDSIYCPKHVLMVNDAALDYKRRSAKSAATRERKRLLKEALEVSPLRAENPAFNEGSRTYSR